MATDAIDTGFAPSAITLNANTGAFTILFGTRLSKYIEIIEDFRANAGVGQGLEYLRPDPTNPPGCTYPAASGMVSNPGAWLGPNGSTAGVAAAAGSPPGPPPIATQGFEIAPQTEPLKLGDIYAIHAPHGPSVANGPNVLLGVGVTGGTPYIAIRSATASTTIIRTTEFS